MKKVQRKSTTPDDAQSSGSSGRQSGNSTATLLSADKNPRKISQERLALLKRQLAEFGDLSGIVANGDELVAGHQRLKNFGDASIVIVQEYDPPTAVGTVAEGFITGPNGERFTFRRVKWTADKARTAMLAANNPAGVWERDILAELIAQIAPDEIDMTGFGGQELTELLGKDDGGQTDATDNDDIVPDLPLVPRVLESYKYVVIITDNLLDFTALCEQAGVVPAANENGYKMPGRVIWYKDFLAALAKK